MMEPNVVIRVKLQLLGLTADEVADSLRAADVKGLPTSPTSCPVAKYLTRKLPGYLIHATTSTVSWTHADNPSYMQNGGGIVVPPPIREFIARFDVGLYPDLYERVPPESN